MEWTLTNVLGGIHEDVSQRLGTARRTLGHSVTLGDASETAWLELLTSYLPKRYEAAKAHVVDSKGEFSQQIDIVIFDRQYSPFVFHYQGQNVIPAESVYAVFETKQILNARMVAYGQEKVESVRKLHRTSLPIPSAGGILPAKKLHPILGGLLGVDTAWGDPFGEQLVASLSQAGELRRLDLGCVAAHGIFTTDAEGMPALTPHKMAATKFLLELIARLQECATAPMIDIRAYGRWLEKDRDREPGMDGKQDAATVPEGAGSAGGD
jgi:hypothetical protein